MAESLVLSASQLKSFNDFLLDGTANTLTALETVFELKIECSDSSIEVGTATSNETLKNFGDGSMHIISSALTGDIDGGIVLFITTNDFEYLSDVMKPVMSLLFMPRPGSDTSVSDDDDPDSMQDQITGYMDDARYREHMLDALGEMGNVLIGLYTQSIYKTYRLNSHHSVPLVMKDPRQKTIQRILYSMGEREKQHVVIENEFFLEDGAIKIWCLISPSEASFQDMIKAIN